ncbi:hypothetical protein D9M72_560100 [compost metagenome]
MAELARNGRSKRQAQCRQAGDNFGFEGSEPCRKFGCQSIFDRKTRLIDDQRGERMLVVRQRTDRQKDLAPVTERRREEIAITRLNVETFRRVDLLPEVVRLHRFRPRLRISPGMKGDQKSRLAVLVPAVFVYTVCDFDQT